MHAHAEKSSGHGYYCSLLLLSLHLSLALTLTLNLVKKGTFRLSFLINRVHVGKPNITTCLVGTFSPAQTHTLRLLRLCFKAQFS